MLNLSSFLRAGALAFLLPVTALAQFSAKLMDVKTATDESRFSVHKNGGLLAGGTFDGGNNDSDGNYAIPTDGAGTRLMWYPGKGAFRAGGINGTQWDDANTGNYSVAMGENCRALGDNSFSTGYNCVAANTGTVALGQYCTSTGVNSVSLGYYAHTSTAAGSPRTGTFVFADRSVTDDNNTFTDEAFHAEATNSAYWRVTGGFRIVTGGSGSNSGYVPSRGVSFLPAANTSGTTAWGMNGVLIATSSGAYLSNTGVWTNTSDRRKKHLFEPVSGEDVLARLRRVPLTSWSYKADPATTRHLGPMAQDFRKAFGLGADSISIGTVDADGVALAAAKALDARTLRQETQLAALRAENQALRHRLDALERSVAPPATSSMPVSAIILLVGAGFGAVLLRRR
jgi:hypothetical protein